MFQFLTILYQKTGSAYQALPETAALASQRTPLHLAMLLESLRWWWSDYLSQAAFV